MIFPMNTHPAPSAACRAFRLVCFVAVLPLLSVLRGADDKLIAAVRAADDERIAATIAGDAARLQAVYSDDLHYAHSNGKIDTKASQIKGLTTGGNRYESFEHKSRTFVPAAPGIVLMKGHMLMHLTNKQSGQKTTNDLNYLAVWREEKGKWRFLAWQSCKNPEPTAAKK
jgi:ketosteroid isomerase-like protein